MKTKILASILCCMTIILSCEKDGDLFRISGIDSAELLSSETAVVLSEDNSTVSVLALTWSESDLQLNDESARIPGSIPQEVIEISSSSAFDTIITVNPQTNTYGFSGAALNTIAKNLHFAAGVSTPMYFRIRTALGPNTEPHYSNTLQVAVTAFSIDMSIGFILNADGEDTGFMLYSPLSNGEYAGFTGVTAWYNWFLLEGDGTTWGNLGVDGNAFVISNDEGSHWNFWYPGIGGCYYTTLSVDDEEWTATHIPELTLSGDVNMAMTFDRTAVKWFASFTTTSDNAKFKVSGNTKRYNISTSTDDAAAIDGTIGFVPQTDSSLTIEWNSASAGEITIPQAGEYTVSFYLADPKKWTFQITSGATVIVEPISEFLYLPGIDDGISGDWTFDNYLKLLSEDDSTFAGTVLVNSLWGYTMSLIKDEWNEVYKMGSTEGTLEFKGASNIAAPDAGLYLIKADLKNLTYSHTAITSLSYAGLNDDWNMVEMDETAVEGVYSSSVTITAASEWGFKLYLNGGWDDFYGGSEGSLVFGGDGITDDAALDAGTYDLIANLRGNSYVLLGNEIYLGGLNDDWDLSHGILTKSSMGIYTGSVTIDHASEWGFQIHLDQSWERFFGGSLTSLSYLGANIEDDGLAAGTYTVTVDFINNTCTFESL